MVSVVEAISQVYASIDVVLIVGSQCGQHSQFDTAGVSVLGHGSDDFDGAVCAFSPIVGLDNFAKCALTEQLCDLIYWSGVSIHSNTWRCESNVHRSVRSASGTTM